MKVNRMSVCLKAINLILNDKRTMIEWVTDFIIILLNVTVWSHIFMTKPGS